MRPLVTMRMAIEDDKLLGSMFPGSSWDTWKALLIASRGEALTDHERMLDAARTGRETTPTAPVTAAASVPGNRSGQTGAAARPARDVPVLFPLHQYFDVPTERPDVDAAGRLLVQSLDRLQPHALHLARHVVFLLSVGERPRPPRVGRNPRSGERVVIPEKLVPHFKPGKALREAADAQVPLAAALALRAVPPGGG